jgi:RimJ/RimL family protein N-acetyltransferase
MPPLPRLDAPLTDGAIALREWSQDDIPVVTPLLDEPVIARWTRVPSPYRRADAEEYLQRVNVRRRSGEELGLVIALGRQLLGSVSLRVEWEHRRGELGYLVYAPARGRGIARRAVLLLSRYAFEHLGLCRLEILAASENAASCRVAETAGFTREGVLRSYIDSANGRADMVCFSLLPGEL